MRIALTVSVLTCCAATAQQFQFMPAATRPASLEIPPISGEGFAVAGDLDGDGLDELVVTGGNTGVLFVQSPGGWTMPLSPFLSVTGLRPQFGDIDGDGRREVVFVPARPTAPRPLQIHGVTSIGFGPPQSLPVSVVGAPVQGAAVGDLDGDGFADLVVATRIGSVTPPLVLLRGGPTSAMTLDMTSMPTLLPFALWPVLLDADGDGDLDVLAGNSGFGLRLLENVGGTFVDASASLPPISGGLQIHAGADLDGDGRDDCAVARANGDVDVLWGNGSGLSLASGVVTGAPVTWLEPGDFDADGDLDLLAEVAGGLDVLWSLGGRQFAREPLVREAIGFFGAVDVDADGADDALFGTRLQPIRTRCLWRARFEDVVQFALQQLPNDGGLCAARDVDGDGITDLVTPSWIEVVVDRGLGGGAFERSRRSLPVASPGQPWRTELVDLDGDGDADLVLRTSDRVSIARNDGAGAFAWATQRFVTGTGIDDLRIGDVDGDGDQDVVYAEDRGVAILRNLGGLSFAAPVIVVPSVVPARCVELVDVDGDLDYDLITDIVAASGLTHVIATNDGAGTFAPGAACYVNLGSWPTSVRAGDLDGDGDLDLAVAELAPGTGTSGRVRLYRGDGAGVFTDHTLSLVPPGAGTPQGNVELADLDGDGDLDLTAVRIQAPTTMVLLNDGAGAFVDRSSSRAGAPLVLPNGGSVWNVRAADIDDDGDVDLIVGSTNRQDLLVNHLRQCRAESAPRLGRVMSLLVHSGPGFGPDGLAALGVAPGRAPAPLALPGAVGSLLLDPAGLQLLSAASTSSIGVSGMLVAVPADAQLLGRDVWFQGAVLPFTGTPGFTNVVYEVVLP
ncbi:MAG: FG-GAP repeat domain-containing protein [Planctomycetota bacterium]